MLAAFFRLLWIASDPLWYDELFSVYWSQMPTDVITGIGAHIETNPPTYYLLLHGWTAVFGLSAFAVRTPSLIFSLASVPVVYLLGRKMTDRQTGVVAGFLVAVDATLIYYANEARPYAMAMLMDGLALLSLVGAIQYPRENGLPHWRWVALFVLASIVAFNAHYTSAFFIAACFLAVALNLLATRPFPTKQLMIWIVAGVAICAGVTNLMMLAMTMSGSPNISWIEKLNIHSLTTFCVYLFVHTGALLTWKTVLLTTFLLLLAGLGLVIAPPTRIEKIVLLGIPILFCLMLAIVSIFQPIMLPRVGIWLIIPFSLLLARTIVQQPSRWRRSIFAVLVLTIFLANIFHARSGSGREDWPAVAQLVANEPRCGGPIMFGLVAGLGLIRYQPQLETRPLFNIQPDGSHKQTAESTLMDMRLHPTTIHVSDFAAFIKAHPRTVIVMREQYLWHGLPELAPQLEQAPFYRLFDGGLSVSCYN